MAGSVFHKDQDYLRFTEMMGEAVDRQPMRVLSWCLMPNHFHLVLWPHGRGDLSTWMQWLMTAHRKTKGATKTRLKYPVPFIQLTQNVTVIYIVTPFPQQILINQLH